jgi:hypothetical protein
VSDLLGDPEGPTRIILAGDMNGTAAPGQVPHDGIVSGGGMTYVPKRNGESTAIGGAMIDSFYVSAAALEMLTEPISFVIRNDVFGETADQFRQIGSDHFPVFIEVAVADAPDGDGDGVPDGEDSCPEISNADQLDTDGDGTGDACDPDSDADRVIDAYDACLGTAPGASVLANGCSVDQACPCDEPWKNNAAFVRCTAAAANELVRNGVIVEAEKGELMSIAGASSCGRER